MSLGIDVCGFAGCGQTGVLPVLCLGCNDTPDDDIFGRRSDYAYCSIEHRDNDSSAHTPLCQKRKLWRTLVRVGVICNMLFMCRQMTMQPFGIHSTYEDINGTRVIVVDGRVAGPEKKHWYQQPMGVEAVLGAVSFNNCRVAVSFLTPVLVWLLEGLAVNVTEKTFDPKNKAHPVTLHFPRAVKSFPAGRHTVIILQSRRDKEMTLDPSSMQYGHTVKTHRHADYASMYENGGYEEYEEIGTIYHASKDLIPGDKGCAKLHLDIRILNDAVWETVESRGGRGRLLDLSHSEFVKTRDKIGRKVWRALARFRADTDRLGLDVLMAREDGPGHIAMIEAMANSL